MSIVELTTTEEARGGFYPTPPQVAEKLLDGIDWDCVRTILEPSAGKGNLVDSIAAEWHKTRWRGRYRDSDTHISVDCIEIDPYLRSILTYEYGDARLNEIHNRISELDEKTKYNSAKRCRGELTPAEQAEYDNLETERGKRKLTDLHIIHDDFLTYQGHKRYDLIVMNPPFADGDAHLLKAIEVQSANGGAICCILNAETILNPYTNRRKVLKAKLDELGADISFVENGFSDAERQTDVTAAIIKIYIPQPNIESEFFDRMTRAEEIKCEHGPNVTAMTVADVFGQLVSRFNVEVEAGLMLIREYIAMRPYLSESFEDNSRDYPTISMYVGHKQGYCRDIPDQNDFLRLVRLKYWKELLQKKEVVGKLTSNLRKKYIGLVDDLKNYDFTLFNIKHLVTQMYAEMGEGVQNTIVALFDRMTTEHTWYPECAKNIHYYNGWKTNKAHKVNNKVILPVHGMFADYSWSKTFEVGKAEETISDIEKVFDYLDGNMSAEVDLRGVLSAACENGQTRNIPCKYFDVTLYKKGTMHIRFRNMELLDRFNIYCSQKKAWLPPNYGRASYDSMNTEERAVVDGFHGNGTDGSGAAEYKKVMEKASYYLAEPTRELPALMGAAT